MIDSSFLQQASLRLSKASLVPIILKVAVALSALFLIAACSDSKTDLPTDGLSTAPAITETASEEKVLTILYWQAATLPGLYLDSGYKDTDTGTTTANVPMAPWETSPGGLCPGGGSRSSMIRKTSVATGTRIGARPISSSLSFQLDYFLESRSGLQPLSRSAECPADGEWEVDQKQWRPNEEDE